MTLILLTRLLVRLETPFGPRSAPSSIDGTLEDEACDPGAAGQRGRAEGAGGSEGVCPVRQRRVGPVSSRVLGAHVTAGREGVSRCGRIHVEGRLAAQPQRDVRPHGPAERTLPPAADALLALAVALRPLAPVVPAVHVSAGEVGPGLALLQTVAPREAGEGQRAQTHRTLRPRRVQLQTQGIQVPQGRGLQQTVSCPPEQRRPAEIHQRTVLQRAALALRLQTPAATTA